MLRFLVAAVLAFFTVAPAASAQCVPITFPGCDATLVAGDGEEGVDGYGDNGPATEARFGFVAGLDLGPDGSLWIADREDGRIRKISPGGTISTRRDGDITGPTGVVGFGEGFAATDPAEDEVSRFNPIDIFGNLEESQMIADIDASDIERTSDNTAYFVADPGNDKVLLVRFNDFTHAWDVWTAADGIDEPTGIDAWPGAGELIASQGTDGPDDCRIRKDLPEHAIEVVVNARASAPRSVSFTQPAHGDGGPAIDAWLQRSERRRGRAGRRLRHRRAYRLRRVGPDGIISTIWACGTGISDAPGSAVHGLDITSDGDVIFGVGGRRILRLDTNYAAPPATPQNPNPVPPQPSPPPPPGPGPVANALTASLGKSAYKLHKGKKLKLKFQASEAGKYRLDILRKAKRVKRASGPVEAGENAIAIRLKKLKPGRYKLALTVTGVSGATATDGAKLKLKR